MLGGAILAADPVVRRVPVDSGLLHLEGTTRPAVLPAACSLERETLGHYVGQGGDALRADRLGHAARVAQDAENSGSAARLPDSLRDIASAGTIAMKQW